MEYLTFTLDNEKYCIAVDRVREVIEHTKLTKLPDVLNYMKGLVNIRGSGIPVIDLRSKFKMSEVEPTKLTSIIVIEIQEDTGRLLIGTIVDSTQGVIELEETETTLSDTKISTDYIKGIGKRNDESFTILNIDKILYDK